MTEDPSEFLDGMCREISDLHQALGLLTTLKPSMILRPEDPIGMAKEIVDWVAPLGSFDLVAHLRRQSAWSAKTFGPDGDHRYGLIDHVMKELIEVGTAENPDELLAEWIDVVILGLDGCWRSGATPEQIVAALAAKQAKNESRKWPDWRTAEPGKAIEHDRSQEGS